MEHGEMLRLVRERQELLVSLDRDALLDIVVWARRPVRQSASKEQLAKEIADIRRMRIQGLSHRGALALALLRGVHVTRDDTLDQIEHAMRRHERFWDRMQRQRRKLVGSLINRMVNGSRGETGTYHFLPEDKTAQSLKEQIVEEGVVGGLARRLRGVADDYVREKLDEIEARIDRKLDEIDRRLAEWRDREITNRLRIIKITLVASIIVAFLSLGYDYVMRGRSADATARPASESVAAPRGAEALDASKAVESSR
jgi:hypothetical protein